MPYRTMTVDGGTGSEIEAPDADAAETEAVRRGYKVLDVMDDIIVIAD